MPLYGKLDEAGLTRFPDWPRRLESFLGLHPQKRFSYGSWDCALFVASCIEAMTGTDIAAEYRGKYRDVKSARETMRRETQSRQGNLGRLVSAVALRHGMREISPGQAQRGDMALLRRPGGPSLGLLGLDGQHLLVLGPWRVVRVPRVMAVRAWRVG
jgi:hypothetical protein